MAGDPLAARGYSVGYIPVGLPIAEGMRKEEGRRTTPCQPGGKLRYTRHSYYCHPNE